MSQSEEIIPPWRQRDHKPSWRKEVQLPTLPSLKSLTPTRNIPKTKGKKHVSKINTKMSFGVIITRINDETNRPEAVLIRGRYSYGFGEFVHGKYSKKNIYSVTSLLNMMSVNERLIIYSLDFSKMWYHIWLADEGKEMYNKKFAKFHASWMRDDSGEYLRHLIQHSQPVYNDSGIHLEFPKGKRKTAHEPDINCAIRETKEETGIDKRDYKILPDFKRKVSYIHMGTRYVNIYYVAITRRKFNVGIDFSKIGQISEISEVKWMDIEKIRSFDTPHKRLEYTIIPVFKYIKRYIRGHIPSRSPY